MVYFYDSVPPNVRHVALTCVLLGIDPNRLAEEMTLDELATFQEMIGLGARECEEALHWLGSYHLKHGVHSAHADAARERRSA